MCEVPEEDVKLLEAFEKNEEWFNEHYEEFQETYTDMVLAIKDKKVISVSAKIEDLLEDLKAKDEDISSVYIGSIPAKGIAFIL